jgi:hypothetical protein
MCKSIQFDRHKHVYYHYYALGRERVRHAINMHGPQARCIVRSRQGARRFVLVICDDDDERTFIQHYRKYVLRSKIMRDIPRSGQRVTYWFTAGVQITQSSLIMGPRI